MSQIMNNVKIEIKEIILSAAGRCVAKGEFPAEPLPDFNIEIPGDRTHGDYAVNAAMVWARALKKAPRMIAEAIAGEIVVDVIPLLFGIVSAMVFGILAIKLIEWLIRKDRYSLFGYYCLTLGLFVLIYSLV